MAVAVAASAAAAARPAADAGADVAIICATCAAGATAAAGGWRKACQTPMALARCCATSCAPAAVSESTHTLVDAVGEVGLRAARSHVGSQL